MSCQRLSADFIVSTSHWKNRVDDRKNIADAQESKRALCNFIHGTLRKQPLHPSVFFSMKSWNNERHVDASGWTYSPVGHLSFSGWWSGCFISYLVLGVDWILKCMMDCFHFLTFFQLRKIEIFFETWKNISCDVKIQSLLQQVKKFDECYTIH